MSASIRASVSVTVSGTGCRARSANGTRTYSAWVPSISCPRTPPPPAGAALPAAPGRAVAAAAAAADAGDQHPVALVHPGHGGAELEGGADRLVAEDASRFDPGHVALEDVQVGAADGGRVHPPARARG